MFHLPPDRSRLDAHGDASGDVTAMCSCASCAARPATFRSNHWTIMSGHACHARRRITSPLLEGRREVPKPLSPSSLRGRSCTHWCFARTRGTAPPPPQPKFSTPLNAAQFARSCSKGRLARVDDLSVTRAPSDDRHRSAGGSDRRAAGTGRDPAAGLQRGIATTLRRLRASSAEREPH